MTVKLAHDTCLNRSMCVAKRKLHESIENGFASGLNQIIVDRICWQRPEVGVLLYDVDATIFQEQW